ncbi:hypothetical protein D3C86_1322900 [compost metagenome]
MARFDGYRSRQIAATPGRPDRREQRTTGAAGKPRQRQADPRNPWSGRLSARVLPLHRRPGGQARRRHPAAGQAGPVCLHRARSHGRGRRDHSVEQPAVPDRDQTGSGTRRRQHHRDQAVGTRLGDHSRTGPVGTGSRDSAGRGQRRHRLRPEHRRRPHPPSAGAQNRLHRRRGHGPACGAQQRRKLRKIVAGTGRQITEHHLRRRRPRQRDQRCDRRDLCRLRAELRVRFAVVGAGRNLRRIRRSPGGTRPAHPHRQPAGRQQRNGPDGHRAATGRGRRFGGRCHR